jgi:hypothetical protein
MTDDWEKKYWAQRQQQLQKQSSQMPHYEPAHIAQDKMRAINGAQQNGGWRDIDPLTAMYTNADGLASRGMGPQQQIVSVREGAQYWRPVQAESFGGTVPMVRSCGPFVGASNKTFEMKNECSCYCIDNLKVIDLGKVDQSQMLRLIEIKAPWIGTVLVRREDIVSNSGEQGPRVLKG